MRYFMFSPLSLTERQAFQLAQPDLLDNHIVHVTAHGNHVIPPTPGTRPQALRGTYLVRVEQDNSLRVVQMAL